MKLEVKVLELTENEVMSILDGAMYGCAYWSEKATIRYVSTESKEKIESIEWGAFSEKGARALMDGNQIRFHDIEEDDVYQFDYEKLKKGVEQYIKNNKCSIDEMFTGNEDIYDMDQIVQYAIFDKIVFG